MLSTSWRDALSLIYKVNFIAFEDHIPAAVPSALMKSCLSAEPLHPTVSHQSNQVIIRGADGAVADLCVFDPFEVLSPHHVSTYHVRCGVHTKADASD